MPAVLPFLRASHRATKLDFIKAALVTLAFAIPCALVAYVPMPRSWMLTLLAFCLLVLLTLAALIYTDMVRPFRR